VFFGADNPQLKAFDALQRIYSREDNLTLVLQPKSGTVFTPKLLMGMRELTDASWKIPFTTRVDSLTNFQNSVAVEDDLTVADLVPKRTPLDAADITRIREAAMAEPLLVSRLIAPDLRTAGINLTLTLPMKSEAEVPEAMAALRVVVDAFRAANPDVRVAVTGSVALNNAFSESAEGDIKTLVPLMYGILLLVMGLLLRSLSGTFATLVIISLSAATAMGLTGWLGIQLTPPSVTAPTIILTLAIADSIHILVTVFHEMRRGATKREALIESLRVNFYPVFLTSLTTAIGFLSLNFSDAPPFRDLGNITAIGVMAAWVYSILLLPALMAVLPVRVKPIVNGRSDTMDRLASFVIAKRKVLLLAMVVLVAGLAAFIPRIELNDQFVKYFDHSIPFRQDTDFAMENLSGIYQAQWSLPAAGPGGISEPDYLRQVDAFSDWLRERDYVVHVLTFSDIMKRLNRNMHGDDPATYTLPEERDLAAQYLLLFEMSLPYGLDLNNQINVDKSAIRIIATLKNITTTELRSLDREATRWFADYLPSAKGTTASGPFVMFAYIAKRNIEGMLTGTFVAFVLISLILLVALRDVKLGLISLAPNLVPAIMAFGIWGALVSEVGLAASVVAATSLGIIVDATVHFLSKYQRARRTRGDDPEAAVRYAFSTVGTALWVTSAILIAGFAVLSMSTFKINGTMGMLTAITLAMAIIVDFLLLPSLLLLVHRSKNQPTDASIPTTHSAE
jgi:predicted RND superfamily exporter protein